MVRSTWTSHVEKWEIKNWQGADAPKVEGKCRQGISKLQMTDYPSRTLRIMTFSLLCQILCCSYRQEWRIPNLILFE